ILEKDKKIDYRLSGVDYSFEYTNLRFGSCSWRSVKAEFLSDKHSSTIKFSNASNCTIYVFCPSIYSLIVEPDLPVQKVEENLFQVTTDDIEELIMKFVSK
ncbi:hypothetical protein, partial [Pseudothermotoga sp.]|uniref:hypothetical protein n=1 Tax=Pseudothermotoga sp. TaxID=2033661 RepID=UPI0031F68F43